MQAAYINNKDTALSFKVYIDFEGVINHPRTAYSRLKPWVKNSLSHQHRSDLQSRSLARKSAHSSKLRYGLSVRPYLHC